MTFILCGPPRILTPLTQSRIRWRAAVRIKARGVRRPGTTLTLAEVQAKRIQVGARTAARVTWHPRGRGVPTGLWEFGGDCSELSTRNGAVTNLIAVIYASAPVCPTQQAYLLSTETSLTYEYKLSTFVA